MSLSIPESDLERGVAHPEPVPDELGPVPGIPTTYQAPAAAARGEHSWIWQVTGLSLVLGFMLALAIQTTTNMRKTGAYPRLGVTAAVLEPYLLTNNRQREEIENLTRKLRTLEESLANNSEADQTLRSQLREIKAVAGLLPIAGPGLKITLRDAPKEIRDQVINSTPAELENLNIHDQDINGLMNELKASGAEAIGVSGADQTEIQRIVAMSSARCVGPTAVVNGVYLSAPYTIYVVGNPKNLRQALEMPQGFVQTRALQLLKMIEIEEAQELVIPAYAGSFTPKYARPAPEES